MLDRLSSMHHLHNRFSLLLLLQRLLFAIFTAFFFLFHFIFVSFLFFLLVLLFQEVCSFSSFPFVSFNCMFACFQYSYLTSFKCTFGSSSSAFDMSLNNEHSINVQNSKNKQQQIKDTVKKMKLLLIKKIFQNVRSSTPLSYYLNWFFFFQF